MALTYLQWQFGLHKWIKTLSHSPATIKRHLSFVRTLKLGSIVSPVLNLAFYFFHLSKTWKGDDRLMYLTQMPWPHNVQIRLPAQFPSFFLSFVPLQPQHTQTPLFFFFFLLSRMQCWTMASSLEAGRLEWNEIWLVNVQSSSTSTHLGIHLCQINWVHSWSCLCKAQAVNGTHNCSWTFSVNIKKNVLPLVALCVINWTSKTFAWLLILLIYDDDLSLTSMQDTENSPL